MQVLDPLATSDRVDGDYKSYLVTSFAPADRSLREDFESALGEPGRTRKGPFVQATPPYKPGASVRSLAGEGVLHRSMLQLDQGALPVDRPLYLHQEQALRRSAAGSNLIVATGTGSGKTECYLLPILNHLLTERSQGTLTRPGVRAMLLYPMNALANDQMKRIRELFAPFPDITFGRYTGETEHTRDKALARYQQQLRSDPSPGELIDRETMQRRPPHVLLTNFAMLEYLLLRPDDSSLFDGPTGEHWRFTVLDEVHVYDGAKGAEVSMLLRRLRDRVNESTRGRLQCMGTSATLGRGRSESAKVAEFARNLFDEAFGEDDVIHPERLPLQQAAGAWSITEQALHDLHAAWLAGASGSELTKAAGRADAVPAGTQPETLWNLLGEESHVVALQRRLEDGSDEVRHLATLFESFRDPHKAVVELVDLCIAARGEPASAPLIPARYHLWLRASEGAFVCLHPDHTDGVRRLLLDRHEHCPTCWAQGRSSQMFEIATCRHCRVHYVVGRLDEDHRLRPAETFRKDLVNLLVGDVLDSDEDVDEDEQSIAEADTGSERHYLCVSCGHLGDGKGGCGCSSPAEIPVTQAGTRPQGEQLRRCLSCKRHSANGVGLRFLSGSEAPVAVLATSLYQCLPPSENPGRGASAGGRKLLMFSDSRQDAAFFAPYLSRTYARAIERHMVWSRLSGENEPFLFGDLVQPLRRDAERAGLLDEDEGRANSTEVSRWLLAEVLATDRRQSLDGLGLAQVTVRLPARFDAPVALTKLGLSPDEALDTVRVLLESVRQSAAVTVPDDVDVRDDLRFAPRSTTTRMRQSGAEPGVLAWVPSRGQNRRTDYLSKLFANRGIAADPAIVLRDVWRDLTEPAGPLEKVLVAENHPQLGTVFALSHERVEFRTREHGAEAFRCDTCAMITWQSVDRVCPTYKCSGSLDPIGLPEDNHYADLYRRLAPLGLTVEEHTGQLQPAQAALLQERFTRGELNALSCSTTFELGVDVGEVQAVLMRNVPPSPANYVQRAGRAGRRLGSAALVVAFAQRRSHDRSFYDHPAAMVDGVVSAPVIVGDNEAIVRRHIHSVAWAQFERSRVDAGAVPVRTAAEFVLGDEPVSTEFIEWLNAHPAQLQRALQRVVPTPLHQVLGVDTWRWVERLLEPDANGVGGWLAGLIAEALTDRSELLALEQEASASRNHRRADALQRTIRTLDGRRLLDLLAQRGVLPKYGFPVDVVDLDVTQSEAGRVLDLNRDLRLGILEFAPGAKVVAANRLWTSTGIKCPSGRLLPQYEWAVCRGCKTLRSHVVDPDADSGDVFAEPCPQCGASDFERRGRFVIPMFGFVGEFDNEQPGEARPPREGHLETFFADYDGPRPETEEIQLGGAPIRARASKRGWITVFNRGRTGRGFSYCSWCGYATDTQNAPRKRAAGPSPHKRPRGGRECTGSLRRLDLGHRYLTNVLELELPLGSPGIGDDEAGLSALYALISAAPQVGVAQNDIGGSLGVGPHGQRTVVIYDDVPGGAGHTRYLHEHLGELVTSAIQRLDECSCGEDTSCYGCLRSFRNQQDHELLSRRAALDVLRRVLGIVK